MTPRYHPSFEEFQALFGRGNVIPVYRQLMADALTPVLAFQKMASGPYAFLLESASGPENIGRYCFLGSSPFALFKSTGRTVEVCEGTEARTWETDNPLDDFQKYLETFKLVPVEGLPRFSCGAVGYMAVRGLTASARADTPEWPLISTLVVGGVLVMGILSSVVPAMRGLRITPSDALRADSG